MCCEKQQYGDGTTVVVLVLQCHAQVETGDEDDDTALHSAAAEGHTETVLALVKQCTRNKVTGRLEAAARVHFTRLLRPGPPPSHPHNRGTTIFQVEKIVAHCKQYCIRLA